MQSRIGAVLLADGGTCTECGGQITEVRSALPDVIGPGQFDRWECRDCKAVYPFSLAPIDLSSLPELIKEFMLGGEEAQ